MPFGYIGQNQTKQKIKNSGVFSSFDVSLLEKKGQVGGSLELIESQTISGTVAQVDFTSSASAGDTTVTNLELEAGFIMYGDLTAITVDSGKIIAYLQ